LKTALYRAALVCATPILTGLVCVTDPALSALKALFFWKLLNKIGFGPHK
jgi:hypothetical protein